MNYNEFKQSVVENFSSYLSERYQSAEVVVKPTNKVNRQVDGIVLMNIDGLPNASPTIYVNDMYEQYLETENFDEVMEKATGTMEHAIEEFPEVARTGVMDFDSLKDNVVLTLINAESNKELLKTVPHRTFEDLAIVYRWYLKHDEQGIYSNLVNNDLAERVGMTEEQLYKAAEENTSRIFPPTVRNMNEVITEMIFGDDIMDLEMKEEFDGFVNEIPDDRSLFVISNEAKIYGAAAILDDDRLYELSEKLGSDLYILPSSVHECIAVSANYGSPEELAEMVHEINMAEVDVADRLSNQVYHYDRDERKLRLATDTQYKTIDDKVAENGMQYDQDRESGKQDKR